MTDHDDLLKELGAALKVEPSAEFAHGVRTRVQKSQTRTTQMWMGLAAAAAVGFAVMTFWRPTDGGRVLRPGDTTPVQAPAVTQSVPVQAPPPVVAQTAPASVPAPVSDGGRVLRPGNKAAPVVRVAANPNTEPRLEVITNQGAVLRELWADARGKRLVFADSEPEVDPLSTKLITVNDVVVRPVVVGEIGKEPGSGGATPIIRRATATKETR